MGQANALAGSGSSSGGDTFELTSLATHLATGPRDGLPKWSGELRSGAHSNLLMGVASCRVDVKQAAARAERWLERVAEPLSALWMPPESWPQSFLDVAWLEVIRNAAHDSICGCSADEVNEAVLNRYTEAARIAHDLTDRAIVRALAASGQPAIVVNPTARTRSGMVKVVMAGDVPPPDAQQIGMRPARERTDTVTRFAAVDVVMRAAIDDPRVSRATVDADPTDPSALVATLYADRAPKSIDNAALHARLAEAAAADPDGPVHLEVVRPRATQEVLMRAVDVPGHGWRGLAPSDLGAHAVRTHEGGLTNGLVTVEPDHSNGTFAINGLAGYGRLVDDGDEGDTYNWSPPADAVVVQRPDDVDVLVSEAGPVRGRIEIVRRYAWPTHISDGYRVDAVEVAVTTVVELRAGEDLVRVAVSLDNPSSDHRLRIHFPLPERAEHSVAECAYGTVTRPLTAEGGPNEVGLPTFPSRRFVSAGGLVVAHDGLCEYELVDLDPADPGDPGGDTEGAEGPATAGEMAVTLLRSVGIISQGPMTMRALPAGPPTPTPAAQMPGHHRCDLVLHVGGRDPYEVADEAFTPLLVGQLPGREPGDPTASGRALEIEGEGVEVTSLTRRPDGRLELRVVNTTDGPTAVAVAGRRGEVTDLRGRTQSSFEGTLDLPAHRIATIALDPAERS